MRNLQNRRSRSIVVLFSVCCFVLSGICQAANSHAVTPGRGTILGKILTANHSYSFPLEVELFPVDGTGPANSTQSQPNGSFSFYSVKFGKYYIIVHTHPVVNRLIDLNRSTISISIDAAAQRHATLYKSPWSEGSHPLPRNTLSFSIAGAHGTTAPSGYSAGTSEESTSRSVQHLAHLANKTQLLVGTEIPGCSEVSKLILKQATAPQNFQINFKLGVFYLAHADYDRSIHYLLIARTTKPSDLACDRDLAFAYLATGRSVEAVALLRDATAIHSSDSSLHLLLANAYRENGNLQTARTEFLRSIEYGESVQNFSMAGAGLLEIGAPNDAAKSFQRGIEIYPNSAKLFMELGIVRDIQHQNTAALSSFLHAIELNPDYAPPYEFLARMANGTKSTDQVIMRRITSFVVTHPEDADAHYDYALALWEHSRENSSTGQLNEIAEELHLAINLNANRSDFHFLLGAIDAERHHIQQASIEFKKCIVLDPSNAEAHYRLSLIYRRLKRPRLSNKELQRFLKLRNAKKLSLSARRVLGSENENIAVVTDSIAPCQQP